MVFAEQERLRKTVIEKFDQRSHEKCGDQRTHTGKQAGQGSDDDTEQVAADPDEFERKLSAVGDHNGDRVIYRDSQTRSRSSMILSMSILTIKQDEIIGNLCYDDSYQEDRKDRLREKIQVWSSGAQGGRYHADNLL